jgi:hypothetical protein
VTDEQRAAYEKDGAICIRGAFGSDWIERLRAAAERNLAAPGPLVDEHVPPGEPGARSSRAKHSAQQPALACSRLLAPRASLSRSGVAHAVPWHAAAARMGAGVAWAPRHGGPRC